MLSAIAKKADTRITYSASENNRNTKKGSSGEKSAVAKAMSSAQRDSFMSQSFAGQRWELSLQPSSSKDLRLTALNKLEQRNFQPAPGGLEIPLTGKAMGGMRRRTNAPVTPDVASTLGAEVHALREAIADKLQFINDLRQDLLDENDNPGQAELTRKAIEQATQEKNQLENRLRREVERARQQARGR